VARAGQAVSHRSQNVQWEGGLIAQTDWEKRNGHRGAVLWCTGYSGAGKSTVAKALVREMFAAGCQVMLLDGDNVRHGLCGDLGFSDRDRTENIRRVAETAKLFYEQGNLVVCTFISPFRADRAFARSIMPSGAFHEVFIKCDLDVCRRRDPKGLYRKAEAGEISEFTGVSSPYEAPDQPELVLETDLHAVDELVARFRGYLRERGLVD
jgi:adenylyl-sulfate kinase